MKFNSNGNTYATLLIYKFIYLHYYLIIIRTLQIFETSKYSEINVHIRGRQIDIEFNKEPNT